MRAADVLMGAAAMTIACAAASVMLGAQSTAATPPAGFTVLFNGKDLSGWRGRPGGGGVFSPYVEAKFTPEERAAKQKEWNDDRDLHWRVDTAKGEIVSDGKGVHLATEKAYGDFELRVEWLLTQAGGDSGIYLRDYPQVQLWDPANPREAEERRGQRVRRLVEQQRRQPGQVAARQGGQSHRRMELAGHQDGRHARLGHPERQAGRRRSGARQFLRSRATGSSDRVDRVADARIGSALPEYLHSRHPRRGRKGVAGDCHRCRQIARPDGPSA